MRRLLFFLAFLIPLSAGVALNHAARMRDVYRSVCDLAEDNFYKADYRLEAWVKRCRLNAARVPLRTGERALLAMVTDQLAEMNASHFQIYDPGEDKRLWTGESIDTGIRARYVEDALIVYRVFPESAADDVDIRAGDEILRIEGTDQVTPWGAYTRAGLFHLSRHGQEFDVNIQPRSLSPDQRPAVRALDARTALLEIPSFRSEFFEAGAWNAVVRKFAGYPNVIVDVRENGGGNFVAMLRALSSFMCGGVSVGKIDQPRRDTPPLAAIPDDLRDDLQIEELDRHRSVGLVTFREYGCYHGRVTVLIGPDTTSVSEIFAEAFRRRPASRIWGQPTAGDVLLAVWYGLPSLGQGYSVSIPVASYLTPEGKALEATGVYPQRELQYDLRRARMGLDGWVEDARR